MFKWLKRIFRNRRAETAEAAYDALLDSLVESLADETEVDKDELDHTSLNLTQLLADLDELPSLDNATEIEAETATASRLQLLQMPCNSTRH